MDQLPRDTSDKPISARERVEILEVLSTTRIAMSIDGILDAPIEDVDNDCPDQMSKVMMLRDREDVSFLDFNLTDRLLIVVMTLILSTFRIIQLFLCVLSQMHELRLRVTQ